MSTRPSRSTRSTTATRRSITPSHAAGYFHPGRNDRRIWRVGLSPFGSTRQIDNARVEAFEALGATGVLIAETGGVSLTVLTSPEENFEPGQPVRLGFDAEQFLYFDAVHGRNLKA